MSVESKPAKTNKRVTKRRAPDVEYKFHDPSHPDGTEAEFIRLKKAGWIASTSKASNKPRVVLLKRTKTEPDAV